jgi:predicted acetyltransferase
MHVAIVAAPVEQRPLLARLMQLYAYDFSETTDADVDDDGLFRAPPVEPCWIDPWRHPFLIRADGACAGFVIVHDRSRLVEGRACSDVGEFFVLRRFRRRGVGARAATLAFDAFPGPWEVRQTARNTAATAFWRKVIDRYTQGRFREVLWDDARWRGPVQMFESAAPA